MANAHAVQTKPRSRPKTNVVDKSAFKPDARARALLRGVKIAQEDLRNAGGAYDLDEVRALMRGVSRQRIDRRVKEGSLLAVPHVGGALVGGASLKADDFLGIAKAARA